MLSAGPSSWTLSSQALGDAVGTSGVNVVRAAQALGYSKLSHLRLALSDWYAAQSRSHESDVARSDDLNLDFGERIEAALAGVPVNELLRDDAITTQEGLATLLARVSGEDFGKAVEILSDSERIVWRAVGPTAFLAQYAALHCQRIGHRSIAITQFGRALADELLTLQRKDALVIFSYGDTRRDTNVVIGEAHQLDSKVVLITDELQEDLKNRATMVLECRRGKREGFQSHAVTLVLIESLILGVAKENAQRRHKSFKKLKRLRGTIDPPAQGASSALVESGDESESEPPRVP